ncbi:DUF1460 domain-containing protein [soil metagenome]
MLLLVLGLLLGAMGPEGASQPTPALADSTSRNISFAGLEGLCPLPDEGTQRAFRRISEVAVEESLVERPFGEVVQRVAELLIGSPYSAGMLDASIEETLVVGLASFDCVLFVESVLALSHSIVRGDNAFASYARMVRNLRYRDGNMSGYCSRLHYFTDWIHDNQRASYLEEVVSSRAVRYDKPIDFMSRNSSRYPKLQGNRHAIGCIQEVEQSMVGRRLHYLPQERIRSAYADLRAGDVVAITTSVSGLDVTHTGFVYRGRNGETGLIHASTTGSVRVDTDLASYIQGNRSQTGVIIARPLPPSR